MPTVKFRPDQPLFKADAFRMPLWVHAPFEVGRGFVKWMTVNLHRDNPHRNAMHNATFTRPAKQAHRNAFWSGRPVVKCAKWRVMVWRWGVVFTVLALVKYLPAAGWWWLARAAGNVLKWIGLSVIPAAWHNLWSIPLVIAGIVLTLWVGVAVGRKLVQGVKARHAEDNDGDRWYVPVLYARDKFVSWVKGRGEYS